jgi:hypothetical protein
MKVKIFFYRSSFENRIIFLYALMSVERSLSEYRKIMLIIQKNDLIIIVQCALLPIDPYYELYI